MTGRLIAVVGPSGVGKDSVMSAMMRHTPHIRPVRRVITRAAGLGGEDYIPATEDAFLAMKNRGAFCLDWAAHGLLYGIPDEVRADVEAGGVRMANLSRAALIEARRVFPALDVLNLTAKPDTLAARLSARGREDEAAIARRLARSAYALPDGINAHTISNDGPLDETVARALAALHLEGTW